MYHLLIKYQWWKCVGYMVGGCGWFKYTRILKYQTGDRKRKHGSCVYMFRQIPHK